MFFLTESVMPGRTLQLGRPDVAAVIDERYAQEPDGWRKRRLLAVKLAAKGGHTSAEIADLCGIARTYLFEWLKLVREGGLEALLTRGKPGPKEGSARGVEPAVLAALAAELAAHAFASAEQARRWLKKEHGVERSYHTVWHWLKKAKGVLRVPRPTHSRKIPGAAEAWKSAVAEKLEGLGIEAGSRVRVWFMDDCLARQRFPFWPEAQMQVAGSDNRALVCTPNCAGSGRCAGSVRSSPNRSNTSGTTSPARSPR